MFFKEIFLLSCWLQDIEIEIKNNPNANRIKLSKTYNAVKKAQKKLIDRYYKTEGGKSIEF